MLSRVVRMGSSPWSCCPLCKQLSALLHRAFLRRTGPTSPVDALNADLVGTVPGGLAVAFRRARHGRPSVLHDEVAPGPGGGGLERGNTLGELRVTFRLIDADQRERRDHGGLGLVGRHGAGRAGRHPAAPVEPDDSKRDSAAYGSVKSRFQPVWGAHDVLLGTTREIHRIPDREHGTYLLLILFLFLAITPWLFQLCITMSKIHARSLAR